MTDASSPTTKVRLLENVAEIRRLKAELASDIQTNEALEAEMIAIRNEVREALANMTAPKIEVPYGLGARLWRFAGVS